jgi:mono/diheme cytochrome c family protein
MRRWVIVPWLTALAAAHLAAQTPPPAGAAPNPPRPRREDFPSRPPADAALVERGKALYSVNCGFCHGSDARGGATGPSLLRSQLVLNDKNGELMAPIIQNGLPEKGMPKIELTMAQIADIAAFVHSFRVGGYDLSRNRPPSIVVGDAKAGEAYFSQKCASCHSVTGDLQGFAAKFPEPRALQQRWLMPRGGGRFGGGQPPAFPMTVTVTLASGQKVEGRLARIDDFVVSLTEAGGGLRTFRRTADTKVDVKDPLQPHIDLLPMYTDKDIHNVTAYLVTLK